MTDFRLGDTNMDVYRDVIKERRNSYYVTYQPADSRYTFAILNLSYPESIPDRKRVVAHMTEEMGIWLNRFPVPTMVFAFNASGDCIAVRDESPETCLMGYLDSKTSRVVHRWGKYTDNELPNGQYSATYLSQVYADVPFQLKEIVRMHADMRIAQMRRGMRLIRTISIFLVGIPLLIEIISLGVNWIGYALWGISVSIGLFKLAKVLGWIKPTKRELEKEENLRKMEHYFYHCEKNPSTFAQLKSENFEQEAIEESRQEFNSLLRCERVAS